MKIAMLFSGGKDSFFALQKILESSSVGVVVSIQSKLGDTQLHAGPEVSREMRKAQLGLLGLPFEQLIIGSDENYLHELFLGLNEIFKKNKITHLATGDLWHPYTGGIGDMLAGALGVKMLRPAREECTAREFDVAYMEKIIVSGIESVIISVRQGNLSENLVGRKIDNTLIKELHAMGIDAAAEGGEYQSFVTAAPTMRGKIIIDDFAVELVDGKNGKEKFYRMRVGKFHSDI